MKTLTISIAAYNVEDYLEQALESCLIPSLEELEVLVVDDGSTDSTAEIAAAFQAKHPGSIRLISKENGGYGSTVNAAISQATGRYFKLLDGDDWFDRDGLESLVSILRAGDADLVLTPYVRCVEGGAATLTDQADGIEARVWDFDECPIPWRISMHSMAYRTEILRESGLRLEENMVYTDTDYVTAPLPLVKTVRISHVPAYQYRIGRDGQSMSMDGRIKHRAAMDKVITRMLERYPALAGTGTTAESICRAWLIDDIIGHLQVLYAMPASADIQAEIASSTQRIASDFPELWSEVLSRSEWARIFAAGHGKAYRLVSLGYRGFTALRGAIKGA